jgi:hypothetical protein
MFARRLLSFALLAISALSGAAQNDHSKAFWVKQYNGIAHMFATKDMKTFAATLDPKFTYIDEKHKSHSLADFVLNEIDPVKECKSMGGTVKVTSVESEGDEVEVGYDWKYSMVMPMKQGDMRTTGREIGVDHWHRVGGKWLTFKTELNKTSSKTAPVKKKA